MMSTSLTAVIASLALGVGLIVAFLPWVIRPLFRLMLWPRYRLNVTGREHLPKRGPIMVAANHITWLDGFLLVAACPRHGKALVNADYINFPVFGWLARRAGLIPVPFTGPKGQRAAIAATRAALDRGEAVGIFPEAQISRNGLIGPFFRGIEVMLKDRDDVVVVPVFLDNLWGSIFSNSGGRFFGKWPKGLRRTVNIVFGPPVGPPRTAFSIRLAVQEAGVVAFAMRRTASPLPETIDLSLPHLAHPELGLLAVSTADVDRPGIHQTGQKADTVGQAAPGVALRIVDDSNAVLPPDAQGRLEARVAGREGWIDAGYRGSMDREGFVKLG